MSSGSLRISSSQQNQTQDSAALIMRNDWDRYPPADRSAWWRQQLTKFPPVGRYTPREIYRLQQPEYPSSTFKSSGRKQRCGVVAKGDHLLPGAYNHRSFTEDLINDKKSYGFKNSNKSSVDVLNDGLVDKKLSHLSPGQYNVESHLSIKSDLEPARGSNFRSRTRRTLPEFEGRDGPPPGAYDTPRSSLRDRTNSAPFKSACPRFATSHNKVPAPGSYDRSYQSGMPANLMRMGRQHGLFFSTSFCP